MYLRVIIFIMQQRHVEAGYIINYKNDWLHIKQWSSSLVVKIKMFKHKIYLIATPSSFWNCEHDFPFYGSYEKY